MRKSQQGFQHQNVCKQIRHLQKEADDMCRNKMQFLIQRGNMTKKTAILKGKERLKKANYTSVKEN